jgi:acetyl-CoA acyltransferase 1
VANKISAGVIDIGLAGGVESMSMYDMMSMVDAEKINDAVFDHE